MASYKGNILRINLSNGDIRVEERGETFYRKYMGGSTLGAYYLLKELEPGSDPLGEKNILVFATSVSVGAPVSGFNRLSVISKSPLTGGISDSQAGGFWAPELKFAGFDGIVIKGKAKSPSYLWIKDGEAEIKNADDLWGKTTGDTQRAIREKHGDDRIRVALIGKAGENRVRYANILNGLTHANGRTGLGAVMGSKNLKAVAVRGTGDVELSDPDTVRANAKWFAQNYRENIVQRRVKDYGTAEIINSMNQLGMLPTRNFQKGHIEGAENLSGETMTDTILKRTEGCYACAVGCKRVVEVNDAFQVDPKYGGPEFETLAALGTNCEIIDLKAVAKANELCNKYGLDTISTGSSIAFAMECFEKGIIDEEDTGGIKLEFGHSDAMLKMIEKIANREGLGKILGDGVKRTGEKIGEESKKFAVEGKGEELAMHDGRTKGMVGFGYAVGPLGGDHVVVEHDSDFDQSAPETFVEQAKPLGLLERIELTGMNPRKMRHFCYLEKVFSFMDSLGLCVFTFAPVRSFTFDRLVQTFNAITGWNSSLWELMKQGEKRINMFRAFNVREGFTREDDTLPDRMFEPIKNGNMQGTSVSKENLEAMKELYYNMRNWDPETGKPKKAKLIKLDLEWVSEELESTPHKKSNKMV